MSDNLSDVRAGVDGIMSAYIDQAVEPAGHVTWKINLSQIAPDSNAVNAVANCVPAKRRKRQSQRSKEPEQQTILESDVQRIMDEYLALKRECLDQHDGKVPQILAANQALLAQKIRAMQQQRHELLPAAQHETGTATGPSSSALGGDAVEGRSCMQQSASEAAGSEAGNESDDHSSSSASSDITARSNPRAQRGTVPAAAARHKHKKTQKPYHARYVFRKSGDGEGVQKSALQVVHLEFASKAPEFFGWIPLARNQTAPNMPPGTKLFYPDNDGESVPIKDPDIELKPWFDERGFTHDYALKKLSQAYHDRLGWLLKALEIGLAQHKAQDSDDEDEGQQTAYEVSCADLADRLIYLWEQDHKPPAPVDHQSRQLMLCAGKGTGVLHDKWCHRCKAFACLQHGGTHVLPNKQAVSKPAEVMEVQACSDSCWRHLLGSDASAAAQQTAGTAHTTPNTAIAARVHPTTQQNGSRPGTTAAGCINPQQDDLQQSVPDCQAVQLPQLAPYQEGILQDGLDTFGPNPCELALLFEEQTCCELYLILQHRGLLREQQEVVQDNDAAEEAAAAFKRRRKRGGASKPMPAYKHVHNMRWQVGTDQELRAAYHPCHCTGPCQKGSCSCIDSANFCEKYCACANCKGRRGCTYQGCNCATGCRATTCPCAKLWRECDPELCRNCGITVAGVAAPTSCCDNMNMRFSRGKRVHIGLSKVAGWGCFIAEPADKGDFIGEYVAELFTQAEADRRGDAYDRLDNSYLFSLNREFVLDARQAGNKLRFANHSQRPNCFTKSMLVDGDYRVGLYADQTLAAGDELSYNYMYALNNAPDWALTC